jgi:gas vesicle protein
MNDSGFGSFVAGLVIGGLIGAAVGLLLAPESGEEMRSQVGDFVDERMRDLGDAVTEGKAAAEQARSSMMAALQAETMADAATEAAGEESAN